jgi:(S)-ureidoglycine aminohydrolase
MHELGHTRSVNCADHLLQTPDAFVRISLPWLVNGVAIVHVAPARGARFLQYTAELQEGGAMQPAPMQRFVYVLEGEIETATARLGSRDYAYFPDGSDEALRAIGPARLAVIEKPYEPLGGASAPHFFTSSESAVTSEPLGGNPALQVRCLLGAETSFDFAVNTMTYQPGAALHMVESHVMEHGLLMLEGGGIYRLGDRWYPVAAGDFIWMAPYCPQWFGALGNKPAKYLIYKDWNRWA